MFVGRGGLGEGASAELGPSCALLAVGTAGRALVAGQQVRTRSRRGIDAVDPLREATFALSMRGALREVQRGSVMLILLALPLLVLEEPQLLASVQLHGRGSTAASHQLVRRSLAERGVVVSMSCS
jgi:hypothetical protein